ncbi:hypothetical protein A2331_06850 [Candidatus Falkowbacteria bacterium RIFOXYB2_FULL_34_18]|uniref:Uncharacterized protein n=1 Tax=Candidatus Falkowbacteria bacterium RIFOXYD2_FULL_34_120 TaxID=1798007 RepID=A0A1F5TRN3_9BACT|nr:MAG: hypothetical protein A2331_06850 [Candidatus Falkowbacteria bacterium RIFOXYB2_FULL_34_18]OGF29961.1 MAG: hypothetical protein A2500_03830 [Candidatus Falkowbacteria bacterium RIFOXYC12_FULL_34_55]OGF41519.1 MAG: hypothetical protein A2531_02400 [Candidatus Falkowbacteria bacterium RIFOXYD2_FULL_34_120]
MNFEKTFSKPWPENKIKNATQVLADMFLCNNNKPSQEQLEERLKKLKINPELFHHVIELAKLRVKNIKKMEKNYTPEAISKPTPPTETIDDILPIHKKQTTPEETSPIQETTKSEPKNMDEIINDLSARFQKK